MQGINKVILIGNLGDTPELRRTAEGVAVTNFSVATNEVWTGKDGTKQTKTEWHRIVVWSKLAELCAQYLQKGRPVYLEGKLQTRSYDDNKGEKRYQTEIVAHQVLFLGGNQSQATKADPQQRGSGVEPQDTLPAGFTPDDIPF